MFVSDADVYDQRDIWSDELTGPSKEKPVFSRFSHEEAVQFVTIVPRVMTTKDFSIGIKLTCRMTAGSKTVYSQFQVGYNKVIL